MLAAAGREVPTFVMNLYTLEVDAYLEAHKIHLLMPDRNRELLPGEQARYTAREMV